VDDVPQTKSYNRQKRLKVVEVAAQKGCILRKRFDFLHERYLFLGFCALAQV
jgi:hypothetical protein